MCDGFVTIAVKTKVMKWINYIVQFLFIRIAKFEFQLHKDDTVSLELYLDKTNEKINTITSCYGIVGFIVPFKYFNNSNSWHYLQFKFAIPFISKQKIIFKKIRKRHELKTAKRNCKNCLFYISQNNTCGKNRTISNLNTFPFEKEMKCFENLD